MIRMSYVGRIRQREKAPTISYPMKDLCGFSDLKDTTAYSGRTWHLIPLERGTPFRLKSAPDSGEVDTPATGFKM